MSDSVMQMSVYRWTEVPVQKITDKLSRKFISGEKITLAQISLKKGCSVVAHTHENEQFSYVISGSIRVRLRDTEITLKTGEVLCIPSNVEHAVVALEDTEDLEVFSPTRDHWSSGKDGYLRK